MLRNSLALSSALTVTSRVEGGPCAAYFCNTSIAARSAQPHETRILAQCTEISSPMDFVLQATKATNTPSHDMTDQEQQCQDLLIEIEELGKQKEEHIKLLARYEGTVQERRSSILRTLNARQTAAREKTLESMQAKLVEHKHHVLGLLHNVNKLQSAYCELVRGLLRKDADRNWIRLRRQRLLTAFHLAKDIHVLIMQNGGDIAPRKRKQSVQGCRRRQRSRKR